MRLSVGTASTSTGNRPTDGTGDDVTIWSSAQFPTSAPTISNNIWRRIRSLDRFLGNPLARPANHTAARVYVRRSTYQAIHIRGDQLVDLPAAVAFVKQVRKSGTL